MNNKILKTLEYSKIKSEISEFIGTASGRTELNEMIPAVERSLVQSALTETLDAVNIYRVKGGIPVPRLADISEALKRLKIDAVLNGQELSQIGNVLRTTRNVTDFFSDLENDDQLDMRILNQSAEELVTIPDVEQRLSRSLEGNGHLTNAASPDLAYLRGTITRIENEIRQKMEKLTRGNNAKYLSEPIVTIRNDRFVLPVKTEYRGKLGGVVHDQSASGQTLYIEPEAVVELNNDLRQNQVAVVHEEQRIFQELSELVAPHRDTLKQNDRILGHFDLLNAKARYAAKIKATEPKISEDNQINLRKARHPLIDPKRVVGNDIRLGRDFKTLIITGPNTGGKTISLKTVGLLQLMGQSGIFIPANENSTIGIFDEVFADIGDEQSIEQNLSTFSSHMDNIIHILAQIDNNSLVLFDELGAGTDPKEGAALAIAILDDVRNHASLVMATTHYPELKTYGYERPETINASMEFNVETLKPTYKLLIGIPGQSNAFDISSRLGLDERLISQARELVDQDSQDLNNMIKDLTNRQRKVDDLYAQLDDTVEQATSYQKTIVDELNTLNNRRAQLLEQAKEEANRIVDNSKSEADGIIKRLRKMESAGAAFKENDLIEAKSNINALRQESNLKRNKVLRRAKNKQTFHVNDEVIVSSYGQRGELLRKIDDKHWEVQMGIIKMKVSTDEMERVAPEKSKPVSHRASVQRTGSAGIKATLDLRGKRYEEAMTETDRYIDAALLSGYDQVTIIHGKGTGALRSGITKYLQSNRRIKGFEYAPANAGGNGATIVNLK